ncbi:MAG: hypothetical protein GX227_00015 [Clostridiaceae bacterium]|nr:hypothetical protein [Clostridiaceae bacterium]
MIFMQIDQIRALNILNLINIIEAGSRDYLKDITRKAEAAVSVVYGKICGSIVLIKDWKSTIGELNKKILTDGHMKILKGVGLLT